MRFLMAGGSVPFAPAGVTDEVSHRLVTGIDHADIASYAWMMIALALWCNRAMPLRCWPARHIRILSAPGRGGPTAVHSTLGGDGAGGCMRTQAVHKDVAMRPEAGRSHAGARRPSEAPRRSLKRHAVRSS